MTRNLVGLIFACTLATPALSAPVEYRYGMDVFSKSQGTLDAFQSITVMREVGNNLHFGQSLYSAAAGDAGGLFIGGFELAKRWQVGDKTQLEVSGFLGGGGGAALVGGDGMMSRAHFGLRRHLFGNINGLLGVSYIKVSGSPISSSALSFGISRDTDFAFSGGHNDASISSGRVLRAVKPMTKQFRPKGNNTRSGRALGTMTLVGIEASFAATPDAKNETFIQATGAIAGDGEGYADIQVGYRWSTAPSGLRAFADVAVGFGGGGDVDTGGGFLASVGAGVGMRLMQGLDLEFGAQATTALDGDLTAITPYLRTSLTFGSKSRPYQTQRRWQLSAGLTVQSPNNGYRKAGLTATAAPVLVDTSIDLFVGKHLYLTGNAQTVAAGHAGGYAVGLMGVGYEIPINKRWTTSVEGMLGAAGGGGVATNGGLVGAAKIELDYAINDKMAISAGVGTMQTLRGIGGAKPITFSLGFKTKFTTFH